MAALDDQFLPPPQPSLEEGLLRWYVSARRWPFDFRRFDGVIIRRRIVFSSHFPFPLSLQCAGMGTGTQAASSRLLPQATSLVRPQRSFLHPGRSIPPPARAVALKTGRLSYRAACSNASRPRLDRREHDGTLDRRGAKQRQFQQRPSDDVTAAPSNSAIGLTCIGSTTPATAGRR